MFQRKCVVSVYFYLVQVLNYVVYIDGMDPVFLMSVL